MESPERAALDDLILGSGVKRGRHTLPSHLVPAFLERLPALGFAEMTLAQIDIEIGTRVPAWLVRDGVADFGTVFWEVFTPRARRKLFGSEVRNEKGDWEIQIYPRSSQKIFANTALAETYDASRPIGMW